MVKCAPRGTSSECCVEPTTGRAAENTWGRSGYVRGEGWWRGLRTGWASTGAEEACSQAILAQLANTRTRTPCRGHAAEGAGGFGVHRGGDARIFCHLRRGKYRIKHQRAAQTTSACLRHMRSVPCRSAVMPAELPYTHARPFAQTVPQSGHRPTCPLLSRRLNRHW